MTVSASAPATPIATPVATPAAAVETYDANVNTIATLRDQVVDMAEGFLRALPGLAIALIILVVTWFIARFAVRIADVMVGRTDIRPSLKNLIDTIVKLMIWIVGIMVAAIVVMPGLTPASLIGGLGIGAVAIGFAFQDIFENFLAGVLIMLREKMRIGDVIECEGITGKVEHITLRETHVRRLSGELTIVPNSMIFKNPVKILTDGHQRRHEVVVGVSYDTNLDHAAEVIRRAVEAVETVDTDKQIDIFAQEFNSSSVDFLVRWWARFDAARRVGKQRPGGARDQGRAGRCGDRNPVPLCHAHLQGTRPAGHRPGEPNDESA